MTVHELLRHFERDMRLCVVKGADVAWWEYRIVDSEEYCGIIMKHEDHTKTFNALFYANVSDWVYREDGSLGIVIE